MRLIYGGSMLKLKVSEHDLYEIKDSAVKEWQKLPGGEYAVPTAYLTTIVNFLNKHVTESKIEIEFAERKLPKDYAIED
jgi:hypothetical protein